MHRFNKFYMYPLAFTFNPIQFPSFWIIELLNLTLISTKKLISLTFLFVLFINLTVTNPYCPSDTSSTRPYLSQLSRPRTQHVPLYALVCTRACTRGPDIYHNIEEVKAPSAVATPAWPTTGTTTGTELQTTAAAIATLPRWRGVFPHTPKSWSLREPIS